MGQSKLVSFVFCLLFFSRLNFKEQNTKNKTKRLNSRQPALKKLKLLRACPDFKLPSSGASVFFVGFVVDVDVVVDVAFIIMPLHHLIASKADNKIDLIAEG